MLPDPDDINQQVAFGTSGHRGSTLDGAFNEDHIPATTQAIVEYRAARDTGPLSSAGTPTRCPSRPGTPRSSLAANDVVVMVDAADRYTPTPAVSHAILAFNRGRDTRPADGIVVTPSHNPPRDGGFKYNPPNGGPADTDATGLIAKRANEISRGSRRAAGAAGPGAGPRSGTTSWTPTSTTCRTSSTSMRSAPAGVRIGADPLGGASVDTGVRSPRPRAGSDRRQSEGRPTWRFMTLDTDGKIRMDCSSPNAMASLIANRDDYHIATGNDADSDRHGIVTPDGGLMNPNHYLAVAIDYLYPTGPNGPATAPSARPRSARRSSTGSSPGSAASWSRCPSVSSGSSTG